MNTIAGLMSIFLGLYVMFTGMYDVYYGYTIDLEYAKYPLSLFFMWVGFRFIFVKDKTNDK